MDEVDQRHLRSYIELLAANTNENTTTKAFKQDSFSQLDGLHSNEESDDSDESYFDPAIEKEMYQQFKEDSEDSSKNETSDQVTIMQSTPQVCCIYYLSSIYLLKNCWLSFDIQILLKR